MHFIFFRCCLLFEAQEKSCSVGEQSHPPACFQTTTKVNNKENKTTTIGTPVHQLLEFLGVLAKQIRSLPLRVDSVRQRVVRIGILEQDTQTKAKKEETRQSTRKSLHEKLLITSRSAWSSQAANHRATRSDRFCLQN